MPVDYGPILQIYSTSLALRVTQTPNTFIDARMVVCMDPNNSTGRSDLSQQDDLHSGGGSLHSRKLEFDETILQTIIIGHLFTEHVGSIQLVSYIYAFLKPHSLISVRLGFGVIDWGAEHDAHAFAQWRLHPPRPPLP